MFVFCTTVPAANVACREVSPTFTAGLAPVMLAFAVSMFVIVCAAPAVRSAVCSRLPQPANGRMAVDSSILYTGRRGVHEHLCELAP
jgi:hypothetical protein